jgi:hypothetical protein
MKRLPLLSLAFAGATAAAGWWTVPAIAVVWVRAAPRERRPVVAAMAGAAIGWALLLGWDALHGPAAVLARRAGGAMGLPPWGFLVLTLLFPALLAGAAAQMARPAVPR